jgi:hypothetical protein
MSCHQALPHPDWSEEARAWVRERALTDVRNGFDPENARREAMHAWKASLVRAQMVKRWEDAQRARGRPTLLVSLFEAAQARRARR